MERITVLVSAEDPITRSGLVSQLRVRPELTLLDATSPVVPDVRIVAADAVDEPTVTLLRRHQRNGGGRLVLVVARMDDAGLTTAVECGVVGLLRRADATPDRLVQVVLSAARGDGAMPPDLLGRLLDQMGRLQRQILHPRGISLSGLHQREIDVLKLVAEGHDTREIAQQLSYSERTVKNLLHDVTSRLHLRNRSHAVAYALRQGLI